MALILELNVILTPIGLAKLKQGFGIFSICYSTTEHFQKDVFLHQTETAQSQALTIGRMWSDDIIQWVTASTQAWKRKELCFNVVCTITGLSKEIQAGDNVQLH